LARAAGLALVLWRVSLAFLCVVVLSVTAPVALLLPLAGLLASRRTARSWSRWQAHRRRSALVRDLERGGPRLPRVS
jgi:hypothetical protein